MVTACPVMGTRAGSNLGRSHGRQCRALALARQASPVRWTWRARRGRRGASAGHYSVLMADRPETRGEAEIGVDGAEVVLGLDMEANPRGWREAEFAGKQADLFAVVTDDLVERVLHQAPRAPTERTTPGIEPGRLRVATDRLAVAAQDVRVGDADDAQVTHAADHPPPHDLRLGVHVGGHLRDVRRRDRLA